MTNPMQFPDGFVFGGATAAYQVEGETRTHGKGKVPWDDFLAAQGRFSPDPASDFYNKYPVDIDLCQRFGINGYPASPSLGAASSPVAPARSTPRASLSITSFSPPATKLALSPTSRSITLIRPRPFTRTAARVS